MMTDKKFDKLMKNATDILNKMPEAHNFSHRTIYNEAVQTTNWYLEDPKMKELMGPNVGAWGNPNPVEKFVMDCEHTINALMGALKEMAIDYDSLERQFNEYRERQPSETAKQLFDHVNGRGVQLIDILVDNDKAHLKVENQKMQEPQFTTLEEAYPPAHRTLDDWNNTNFKESEKSLEIKIGDAGYVDQIYTQENR